MKMHFIVYFIGILSALTIVKCNVEHVGKNEINSSENDAQDDDETLNGINLSHDDPKINVAVPSSLELRKKKCGKTKQACKDAGGYCHARAKKDECDGKILKGKKYCAKNKKCGCCVPKEKPPCTTPETCTYNGTKGLCFREKPQGFIFRGPQECGGTTSSSGCNCYTPEPLCATSSRGTRQLIPYHRKNALSEQCVCFYDGNALLLIPGQCDHYNNVDQEWCYINSPIGVIGSNCGDFCFHDPRFIFAHTCWDCVTPEMAAYFCHIRHGNRKKVNSVFKTCPAEVGKHDWALNNEGTMEPVCMTQQYVMFWYCERNANTGWQCRNTKFCAGGGTLTTGPGGTGALGHYSVTTLHCIQAIAT